MFEASINILSPDGIELSYSLICNQDELNELLRKYDANELSYKRIMQAKLSASKETAFCPYCMKLEFIKDKNEIHVCKDCHKKYFVQIH